MLEVIVGFLSWFVFMGTCLTGLGGIFTGALSDISHDDVGVRFDWMSGFLIWLPWCLLPGLSFVILWPMYFAAGLLVGGVLMFRDYQKGREISALSILSIVPTAYVWPATLVQKALGKAEQRFGCSLWEMLKQPIFNKGGEE